MGRWVDLQCDCATQVDEGEQDGEGVGDEDCVERDQKLRVYRAWASQLRAAFRTTCNMLTNPLISRQTFVTRESKRLT